MMINLLPKSYHFLKSAILVVTKGHITLTDFIYRYFPLLGNEWKKVLKKTQFFSTWQRWHSSSERSVPKIHFKMEWWSAGAPTAFQKVYHQQEDQAHWARMSAELNLRDEFCVFLWTIHFTSTSNIQLECVNVKYFWHFLGIPANRNQFRN